MMFLKVAKKIRIAMLILACIAVAVGVPISKIAEEKAATDVSKIKIEIISKDAELKVNDGWRREYNFGLTYKITNGTEVKWESLDIETRVYDKKGVLLGTLTTSLGRSYSGVDLELKAGQTITRKVYLRYEEGFSQTIFESKLSDLKFEFSVTSGTYSASDGSTRTAHAS